MCIPIKFIASAVLPVLCFAAVPQSQNKSAETGSPSLQQRYDAAQHFLNDGNLHQADEEFRGFLAEALGELAVGQVSVGDYTKAASLFDDALVLKPDSPALRLEYARAALVQGDEPHSETLAKKFLKDYPGDANGLAQAHQILGRALLKMNQNQDARKELEAAVALDPTFENGYDLAVACLDLDDQKCAQQIFGEMELSFGDSAALHMQFGRAYGNSDFQQLAIAEFKKAIAKNPREIGAHYSLAATLLALGDDATRLQEADAELKLELAISPDDALTYAALGKIAISRQKYAEAEKYLKRSTALDSKSPDPFLYLGQMYVDTNDPANAETALRQCIRLTTDVSRNRYQIQKAHYLLGRLLMQQHKEEEARVEMQLSHALLDKGLAQDRRKMAGLLDNPPIAESTDQRAGDTAPRAEAGRTTDREALRKLNALKKQVAPAVADSYNNLGAIAATSNQYAQALTYFQHAAEWNPSLDSLDYNLGRAAFMASRFDESIEPLSRSLRAHASDSSIRIALGISQFMTKDYAGCIRTLQSAEAPAVSVPQVEYVFAESLVKTGKIFSGVERLEALEKLHPEIAEVHRSLGEVFALQGEPQKAIDELRTAIKLNINDPEARYDLGKVDLSNGDAEAAISELESAVNLLPTDPEYHKQLADAYKTVKRATDAEKEIQTYNTLRTRSEPQKVR